MKVRKLAGRLLGVVLAFAFAVAACVTLPMEAHAQSDQERNAILQGLQLLKDNWNMQIEDPDTGDLVSVSDYFYGGITYEQFLMELKAEDPEWFAWLFGGGSSSKKSVRKQAVVSVTSDVQTVPYGSTQSLTFKFPRNITSPFSELDSVRVATMNAPGTDDVFWVGPSHYTADGKSLTLNGDITAMLAPGKQKIQFLFSDFAYAQAEISVVDATTFDAAFYAKQYPDVVAAVGNDAQALYNHYVAFGKAEGRLARAQ